MVHIAARILILGTLSAAPFLIAAAELPLHAAMSQTSKPKADSIELWSGTRFGSYETKSLENLREWVSWFPRWMHDDQCSVCALQKLIGEGSRLFPRPA